MWFALGAASSILDSLQSLGSSKSGSGQSNGSGTGLFDFISGSGSASSTANFTPWQPSTGSSGQISPQTMSDLIATQGQSGTNVSGATSFKDPLQDLFSQIDGNGDGQISKSEFESALGAGGTNVANADSVFGKLDSNGDGSVNFNELKSALKGGHHGHHHAASSTDSSGSNSGSSSGDPLMQALSGASSSSTSNSDGSTSTTITYADGSKVTMTLPAVSTSASSTTSSYNLMEQLIQRQSNALSSSPASTTAVNA